MPHGVHPRRPQSDWLNQAEARALLHISRPNLTGMLASAANTHEKGKLYWRRDPLDKRLKLVRRKDVEALLGQPGAVEEIGKGPLGRASQDRPVA